MADTIRSIDDLNTRLADNGLGKITPQDLRDMMVSQMVHGEIGSGAKAAITLTGTNYRTLDLTVGGAVERGVNADPANKIIAGVPVRMKAIVHCEVCFRGAQNTAYEFSVFRNPLTTPVQQDRLTRTLRPTAAADIVAHTWSTSLQLEAGDSLQFGVKGNGATFELLFAVLRVQRIGVE